MEIRYACLSCPPVPTTVPMRGLLRVHTVRFFTPTEKMAYGWADYNRELNPEEVEEYKLEMLGQWQK
jgi:hypothetical protein